MASAGDILFSVRAPQAWLNVTLEDVVTGRGYGRTAIQEPTIINAINAGRSADMSLLQRGHDRRRFNFASIPKKDLENQVLFHHCYRARQRLQYFATGIDFQVANLVQKPARLETFCSHAW